MFENLLDSLREPSFLQLPLAFFWGFLSSFTPCVFPLIPVTLALFGIEKGQSRARSITLAFAYVFGIATTYTVLGMISAKSGVLFGSFLGNPWVILLIAAVLVLLSLFTLDVINLRFVSRLQNAAGRVGGQGLLGAYLMGAASGFVAAPCIGPALVVVLGVAAASQSVAWGAALLLSYSLGLGLIFLLLAAFSGLITKLPRSGHWLQGVKFVIATALMLVALFIARRYLDAVLPTFDAHRDLPLFMILLLAGLSMAQIAVRKDLRWLKIAALVTASLALYEIVFSETQPQRLLENGAVTDVPLVWTSDLEAALSRAARENKIVLVDLYADWCLACKELDVRTFSDPRVRAKLSGIITARIDFTEPNAAIAERYGIIGLPAVLFLNPDGSEIAETRITGFVPPDEFLTLFDKASGEFTAGRRAVS